MRGFRRYRAFVAFAAIALIILYRISYSSEDAWDSFPQVGSFNKPLHKTPNVDTSDHTHPTLEQTIPRPASPIKPTTEDDPRKPNPGLTGITGDDNSANTFNPHSAVTPGKTTDDTTVPAEDDDHTSLIKQKPADAADGGKTEKPKAKPGQIHDDTFNIPDRVIAQSGHHGDTELESDFVSKPKGSSALKQDHWKKPTEHFPIPTESLRPLPTGKPADIPTIQFKFEKETADAQKVRETRLAKVKAEAVRAWKGYRKYAFGHDELSPVTKKFRDPFCGWAATLVDSLDTLWIMGLKDEFEEAVLEVAKIDFTTTRKTDIPVFETTIRYLGGLLAAYDVSGGKTVSGHKVLLDKAVELAEILMGVFDTPNRMPILYYNWRPAAMEKAKRASSYSNLAELGSLSMEFTRLAQLTGDNRYYDAIDRITDALQEWQNRGTTLPGIFPDNVDAGGCNRTAEAERASQLQAESTEKLAANTKPKSSDYLEKTGERAHAKGFSVDGGDLAVSDHNHGNPKPGESYVGGSAVNVNTEASHALTRRTNSAAEHWDPSGMGMSTSDLDCIAQGLAPASYLEAYGMGGGQDSTYEYFPKQYLLLGGLEPKYKTIHKKVSAAVKKWLLFRPMVADDRDLLFSAKLTTRGDPTKDARTEYEVTHLTCFLGGMFGMAGKIFNDPDDVEIGKRLTDGCVWAYESTPTGIMPEGAYVVPCANVNKCEFNQTLWWQHLDPQAETREAQLADYYKRVEELKTIRLKLGQNTETETEDSTSHKFRVSHPAPKEGSAATGQSNQDSDEDWHNSEKLGAAQKLSASKTGAGSDSISSGASGEAALFKRSPLPPPTSNGAIGSSQFSPPTIESEDQIPLDMTLPARPISHKEYVENRIETEKLPPGFTDIRASSYILRPEAIESVWYMYRITGDSTWQDKGWKMFESIIRHTQTEAGHSAIHDVMVTSPDKKDEMESFWLAETLKYFFLLYSTPDVISLDEWVLNTEAHPFRRPS